MKKLIFIANPRAGRMCFFSGTPVLDFIQQLETELTEWDVRVLLVNNTDELKAKLARFSPESIHAIFTVGGDGTLNRCLDTLLPYNRKGIPIGILPAGTANDFAVSLGMSLSVDCVARAVTGASMHAIDVIRVNGSPLLTVGGTGIGSLLLDEVERARQGSGRVAMGLLHAATKSDIYSLLALKSVLTGNIDPADTESATYRLRATASIDDGTAAQVSEFTTTSMFICNQPKLGGDLLVSPASSTSDGIFEMVALQGLGRAALASALLNFKRGRPAKPSITLSARSLLLEELDGRPITFFGDGEILHRSARIELGIEQAGLSVYQLATAPAAQPVLSRLTSRLPFSSEPGRAAA